MALRRERQRSAGRITLTSTFQAVAMHDITIHAIQMPDFTCLVYKTKRSNAQRPRMLSVPSANNDNRDISRLTLR